MHQVLCDYWIQLYLKPQTILPTHVLPKFYPTGFVHKTPEEDMNQGGDRHMEWIRRGADTHGDRQKRPGKTTFLQVYGTNC